MKFESMFGEEHEHTEASLADIRETEEALAKQEGVSPDTKAQTPRGGSKEVGLKGGFGTKTPF